RHVNRSFYYEIVNMRLSVQNLSRGIVAIFKSDFGNARNERLFATIEAELIYTYSDHLQRRFRLTENVFDTKTDEVLYKSEISEEICSQRLKELNSWEGRDFNIEFFINHIELTI